MSHPTLVAALTLASLAAASPVSAAGVQTRLPPAWSSRVLLVSASNAADPRLSRQRQTFAAMGEEARERDLVLVEAVGDTPEANALRQRYGLDGALFASVLIGKDGGAKLRSADVLGPNQLFPTIDAMPMRRAEMGERPTSQKR